MTDSRIVEHLQLLFKYLDYLEILSQKPKEKFLSDMLVRGAAERYLQLAIESCINIGGRILALQELNPEITAPVNYADVFIKLGEMGIFEKEFVIKLVNMARFRNRLVHGYWEIDPEKLYDILQENLVDIRQFAQGVTDYTNKQATW